MVSWHVWSLIEIFIVNLGASFAMRCFILFLQLPSTDINQVIWKSCIKFSGEDRNSQKQHTPLPWEKLQKSVLLRKQEQFLACTKSVHTFWQSLPQGLLSRLRWKLKLILASGTWKKGKTNLSFLYWVIWSWVPFALPYANCMKIHPMAIKFSIQTHKWIVFLLNEETSIVSKTPQ